MKNKRSPLRCILKPFIAFFAIIFSILATIVLSFLVCLFVPDLIYYRIIIYFVARSKLPNAKLIGGIDALYSVGETYSSSNFYNTLQIVLDGKVSFESMKNEWTELIVNKINSKSNQLQFPELQEYIQDYKGHSFRRKDESFDIENHFKLHKEGPDGKDIVDKIKLLEIRKKFQASHFTPNRSPWEVLVVQNYRPNNTLDDPECSVFIFKYHQVIGDSNAIVDLFWKHLPRKTNKDESKDFDNNKINGCQMLGQILKIVCQLLKMLFCKMFNLIYDPQKSSKTNPLKFNNLNVPSKFELCISDPISKRTLQEIKSANNVSELSILVNSTVGGLRKMMKHNSLNIPKSVKMIFPVTMPSQSDLLTNNTFFMEMHIPFLNDDGEKRLLSTNGELQRSNVGPTTVVSKIFIPLLTTLPNSLRRKLLHNFFTSFVIQHMKIPSDDATLFGNHILTVNSVLNMCHKNCGFVVSIVDFDDDFCLSVQVNSNLLSHQDETKDLEKYLLEELDLFSKNCT